MGNQSFIKTVRGPLEILPYGLHFSEVMPFTKIIKDING